MKQVLAKLDEIHQQMMDLVTPLDEERFAARFAPGRWSAAENIHHLYLVETKYVGLLQEALASSAPGMGPVRRLFQVPPRFVGVRLVRVKVPEKAVEPLNAPPKAVTLDNYNRVRGELKSLAAEHGAARLRAIAVPHPMFRLFDGVNAVLFLGYHELRHYKQIREMMK
jgi:hypothetical protein